jgi:hypothetical protein
VANESNYPVYSDATANFTQIIWKSTKKIGIGLAQGRKNNLNSYYCVVQYQPAGNVDGLYNENVKSRIVIVVIIEIIII